MRSLLCQRRKKCAFLTEEKSTKRLIEATASNSHASAGKAYTHGSQQTEPRTYVRSPSFAVRRVRATGNPAAAGVRRAPCERLPIRCQQKRRRLTDHASSVSVDAVFHSRHRTAASRANDRTERSRFLFVLFLSVQEKDTFLLYQRRIKMSFSHRRENDEKSRRDFCLGLSSCCWQAHTHGSQQTEPRTYVRSPSINWEAIYTL